MFLESIIVSSKCEFLNYYKAHKGLCILSNKPFNWDNKDSKDWENLTMVLPEVGFPFHEFKEMTEESARNQKTVFLRANINRRYWVSRECGKVWSQNITNIILTFVRFSQSSDNPPVKKWLKNLKQYPWEM